MTEWRPDIEFQQLKGRSAARHSIRGLVLSRIAFPLFLATVALGLIFREALMDSPLVLLLIVPLLVTAPMAHWHIGMFRARREKEAKAGYATAPDQSIDLVEVDWVSSRVIRLAGEPRLDRDEYERRVRLVRGEPENTA